MGCEDAVVVEARGSQIGHRNVFEWRALEGVPQLALSGGHGVLNHLLLQEGELHLLTRPHARRHALRHLRDPAAHVRLELQEVCTVLTRQIPISTTKQNRRRRRRARSASGDAWTRQMHADILAMTLSAYGPGGLARS